MRKHFLFVTLLVLGISTNLFASKVDTVKVFSPSMQKEFKTVVITPDTYSETSEFPVLYLLHGFGDNYAGWITKAPVIKELADLHNLIIICPDGGRSWYFDSPIDPSFMFETFITKELIAWADENYKTIKDRKGRAVTGLSMGGHGGLYLGFRNQDVFGACGSMSGGVDIRPFPNNWDIAKRLGAQREHPENWEKHTVMNQLHFLTPNSIEIIIDCGTGDFFYEVNQKLHNELIYRNIPHDYITRPGVHNWDYWNNAIKYQVLFFSNFFKTKK